MLAEADEIVYVSEEYTDGCMKKRNQYMVDRSSYCICALLHPLGRIDQTAKYAKQTGSRIINVAE
ncbi:MAG: hypothetical protein APF81_16165 [Desulfosporosinus sp. BRH_c37]|nr:MAG: hypothetical protein APF81_16165 [Desulfosporosinus sp. BRH_c37]